MRPRVAHAHTLKYVLSNIQTNPNKYQCVFEHRPKWKFGVTNYGELPQWINNADGDPWDVFTPTPAKLPVSQPFRVSSVIGVLVLENGNHKIAVRVKDVPYYASIEKQYITTFCEGYAKYTGVHGKFIYLE